VPVRPCGFESCANEATTLATIVFHDRKVGHDWTPKLEVCDEHAQWVRDRQTRLELAPFIAALGPNDDAGDQGL
jgi:hypothetical protein